MQDLYTQASYQKRKQKGKDIYCHYIFVIQRYKSSDWPRNSQERVTIQYRALWQKLQAITICKIPIL